MKVYLSGSFDAGEEVLHRALQLRVWGYDVTSSWLHEPPLHHDDPDPDMTWQKRARANEDFLDIERSDLLVAFTEWGSSSGGLHTEIGMALANRIPVHVVGPRLNIFHHMAAINHWPEYLEWLSHMRLETP